MCCCRGLCHLSFRAQRILINPRLASSLDVSWALSAAAAAAAARRLLVPRTQEIFGSYGKVTSVDLAVDKRVNLPKVNTHARPASLVVAWGSLQQYSSGRPYLRSYLLGGSGSSLSTT